jgi:hypothetical protein
MYVKPKTSRMRVMLEARYRLHIKARLQQHRKLVLAG